jgi:hypothetical protein
MARQVHPRDPAPGPFAPGDLEEAALRLLAGRDRQADLAPAQGPHGARRFAAAFRRALLVEPEAFAALRRTDAYTLAYGGPFAVGQTLRYLGRDRDNLAERVEGNRYRRFFPVAGRQVAVTLTLDEAGCGVALDGAGARLSPPALLGLHRALIRFLGLDQPLAPFYRANRAHPVMGPLVRRLRGVRIPQVPSLWEALCWAVIGQQINLAFAYRLRNRFIALGNGIGEPVGSGAGDGGATSPRAAFVDPLPFPTPEQALRIPSDAWRAAQFSRQKARWTRGRWPPCPWRRPRPSCSPSAAWGPGASPTACCGRWAGWTPCPWGTPGCGPRWCASSGWRGPRTRGASWR